MSSKRGALDRQSNNSPICIASMYHFGGERATGNRPSAGKFLLPDSLHAVLTCIDSPRMRFGLLLLLLLAVVISTNALTLGEESAIEAFLNSFPQLAHVTPPWSSNTSLACSEPPFYGVSCSSDPDPHVVGLYVSCFSQNLAGQWKASPDCPRPPDSDNRYCLLAHESRNLDLHEVGSIPSEIGELSWLSELYVQF